jgi:hypothetical protein
MNMPKGVVGCCRPKVIINSQHVKIKSKILQVFLFLGIHKLTYSQTSSLCNKSSSIMKSAIKVQSFKIVIFLNMVGIMCYYVAWARALTTFPHFHHLFCLFCFFCSLWIGNHSFNICNLNLLMFVS